jgi:RNA polymerase sigma factor FliA
LAVVEQASGPGAPTLVFKCNGEDPMTDRSRGDVTTDINQLWLEFKASADDSVRERLIIHYAPLVKFVAGRVSAGLPRNVDQADLASYGIFGLIDAIDKFEPERGFKFETYAINRVKGAILDELRSLDWVPRSVRAKAREIERSIGELEHRLQRSPTDEELADALETDVDSVQEDLAEISQLGIAALDQLVGSDEAAVTLKDLVADPGGISP